MVGLLIVDAAYALSLLAAIGFFGRADPRAIRIFGWGCLVYGATMTYPWAWDSNSCLAYSSGGLVLTGAILLARYAPRDIRFVLQICLAGFLAFSLTVVLEAAGLLHGGAADTYRFGGVKRFSGVEFDPISAGENAATLVGLCLGCLAAQGPEWIGDKWRPVIWMGLPLGIATTFLTNSRAPILALVVVSLTGLIVGRWLKRRPLVVGSLLSILACCVLFVSFRASSDRLIYSFQGDPSAEVRVRTWMATPGAIGAHPWGGIQNDPDVLVKMDNNSALGLFGQIGLVGGLPLLAMLIAVLVLLGIRIKHTRLDRLAWPAVFATMTWLLSEQFFGSPPDWMHTEFLWCLLGLCWYKSQDRMEA